MPSGSHRPADHQQLRNELEQTREALRLTTLRLEQTEAALWQMSVLFTTAPLPIVIADTAACVTDLNPEAERRFGIERHELLGKPLLEIVPKRRRVLAEKMLERCLRGETIRNVGGLLWEATDLQSTRTTLWPLFDQRGQVGGITLSEDLRELKETGAMLEDVNEHLRHLALADGLTHLGNRRQFERVFEREVARAARARGRLSLVMIDIDAFKRYNDALGHPAGDICLKAVAEVVASCVRRPADFVARYGGEEFAVLLPGTSVRGAAWMSEKIRAAVEERGLSYPDSETSSHVTVSVGVATACLAPGFSGATLLQAADRALYAAKEAGRNRVCFVDLAAGGAEQA